MELQEALDQLIASCHSVASSREGLQRLVDLQLEEATARRVLGTCQDLIRSPAHHAGRRLLILEGDEAVGNFCIISGTLVIMALLWELWIRSSMVCCRQVFNVPELVKTIKALGGRLADFLQGKERDGESSDTEEEANLPEDFEKPQLWHQLTLRAKTLTLGHLSPTNDATSEAPQVGFAHLNFTSRASKGEALVELVRRGCEEVLQVRLRPRECQVEEAEAVADNGKDYTFHGASVRFEKGQEKAELSIPLHQPRQHRTTGYFEIELFEVEIGHAVIGGPSLGLDSEMSATARVYISYDYAFPHNIPPEKLQSRFWITWYYLLERKAHRGWHWWKTLLGLLYAPVHAVCVTAFIQKIVLDQICDPDEPGNKTAQLLAVGLAQFGSTALLRWGDQVATKNRGRTGGTRMVHRQQLFAKLLMLDAEELAKVRGYWWFYVGVNNVDLMAKDAYYQGFVVIQSGFGLILSIGMLIYVQWTKYENAGRDYDFGSVLELSLFQIGMVLLCLGLLCRTKRLGELLIQRMAGEAAWVDSLSWICHAGLPLKSLASRICARVDMRFMNEVKYFLNFHVRARDWSNDTLWYVRWLTNLSYIMVLLLGARELLEQRASGETSFQSGDFVFQLKIFSSFGKYLAKIVDSLIKMYSASVGLQQFAEIMNWPERSSGTRRISHDSSQEIVFDADSRRMELVNPSVRHDVKIPLRCTVRVTSQRERHLLTFLHQVAELKMPHKGRIRRPKGIRIAFVPAIALHTPHSTVLQELKEDSHDVAEQLVAMFQLEPGRKVDQLQAGQRQSVALLLAMFRNPDVLVLDRPLAFLTPTQRQKMLILLSLWQAGGADALLQSLRGAEPKFHPRTLILSSEVEDELPKDFFRNVQHLDLDLHGHIDLFSLVSL